MLDDFLDGMKAKMADRVGTCEGCGSEDDVEGVEMVPLDPIDHSADYLPLCADCREWADERNALAEQIGEELRERRRELGEEYAEAIEALAEPPEGFQSKPPTLEEMIDE